MQNQPGNCTFTKKGSLNAYLPSCLGRDAVNNKDHGKYTIVETKGNWGKLKSGAGWINCSDKYCKRV